MNVQLRRCIGSERFGIEAHNAPTSDFPTQPSQKDSLGRMCKPHWRQYTNALRKAALARKAAPADDGTKPTRAARAKPAQATPKRRSANATPAPRTARQAAATVDAPSAGEG